MPDLGEVPVGRRGFGKHADLFDDFEFDYGYTFPLYSSYTFNTIVLDHLDRDLANLGWVKGIRGC
jgi:hypothetical protein